MQISRCKILVAKQHQNLCKRFNNARMRNNNEALAPILNCICRLKRHGVVSRGQTAFFRFYLWWRKKGLVWFTHASRLDTFECVNKLHHQYSSI